MISIKKTDRGIHMEIVFENEERGTERVIRIDVDNEFYGEINASATGELSVSQTKEFIRALQICCAVIDNEITLVQ